MTFLTPQQVEQIAERDYQWRRGNGRTRNPVCPLGRNTNAAQAANDRHHLLQHVHANMYRPHERYEAQRKLRRARVALAWLSMQQLVWVLRGSP